MFTNTSTLIGLLIYGVIAYFIMKVLLKVYAPNLLDDIKQEVIEAMNSKASEHTAMSCKPTEPDVYPYVSCGSILTPTELTFFNALVPVINGHWHIFTKVRMEDIINVKSGLEKKKAYGFRSRIKSRHVDFILCDKETLEILMCIELDDSSHQSAKAKETDAFKDKAFKDAGLTLIRIPARRSYPEHVLKQAIFEIDPEELIPQTQEAAVSPATNEDPHARWKPASMSK